LISTVKKTAQPSGFLGFSGFWGFIGFFRFLFEQAVGKVDSADQLSFYLDLSVL